MDSPPQIPYQAYKPKRHSRTVSSPHMFEPNVSPPPQSRAPSFGTPNTPPKSTNGVSENVVASKVMSPEETERRNGSGDLDSSGPRPSPGSLMGSDIISEEPSSKPQGVEPSKMPMSPLSPVASSSKLPVDSTTTTGPGTNSPSVDVGSSTKPSATQRKASTFRYVPLRPSSSSSKARSPPSFQHINTHVRSLSAAPPSTHPFDQPQRSAEHRNHSISFGTSRPAPSPLAQSISGGSIVSPSPNVETPISKTPPSVPIAPPRLDSPTDMMTPPQRTTSLGAIMQPPPPPPKPISPSPGPSGQPSPGPTAPIPSRTPTPLTSSAASRTLKASYRPGFQPKGVYRPLTDDFLALRQHTREVGRVDRTRLERRLEKLITLHFSDQALGQGMGEKGKGKEAVPPPQNRRASSFFDFDLNELRTKGAAELLKSVLESRAAVMSGGANDIRAAEQKITPWQDDASVSACPLCSASFHPLTNRKHHCRLCGQIICSLPVKQPQRPVVCSILFVADPKTGRIEEVSEGVDYGVRPRSNSGTGKGPRGNAGSVTPEEKFLKGVRICKECKPVMLRQQYKQESRRVPTYARLYEALTLLEAEIEEALPQFQELMLSLSQHPDDAPSKEATMARKRLLESFAEYDALSKRIRKLSCPGGAGSSQDRVQQAIRTRAHLFLQKNMFPLQSLPKPKKRTPTNGQVNGGSENDAPVIDPDSELAHALQPLLEQEALLESFIEEATAHRKFEDAKTLKSNLSEIRLEIDRIMANAQGGIGAAKMGA